MAIGDSVADHRTPRVSLGIFRIQTEAPPECYKKKTLHTPKAHGAPLSNIPRKLPQPTAAGTSLRKEPHRLLLPHSRPQGSVHPAALPASSAGGAGVLAGLLAPAWAPHLHGGSDQGEGQ